MGYGQGFRKVFFNEIKTIFTRPKRLLLGLGIPSFLFFLYASIFGSGTLRKVLPIVLMNEDKSSLSRELVRQFQANPTLYFAYDVNNYQEAMHLVRTGKAYGVIVIPNNFERDISVGKNVNLPMYINGDYMTPAGLLNKAFNSTLATFSTSAKINVLMKSGLSTDQAKVTATPISQDTHTLFNPYVNYAYYLCMALFPMALQLTVMVMSLFVLGSVLKYNRGVELYEMSGRNVWKAYWGQMLPYTLLYFLLATMMIAYLFYYLKIPINCPISTVFVLTFLLIIVYQLMAVFFVSISKDFKGLCTAGGAYSSLAFSFSGYTFPASGMPLPVQIFDFIFPFAAYARLLTNTAMKGMPIQSSGGYVFMLLFFGTIGLLSLPKYAEKLKKGKYA